MQEEAHQMINFNLNFHYVDSISEGKGYKSPLNAKGRMRLLAEGVLNRLGG